MEVPHRSPINAIKHMHTHSVEFSWIKMGAGGRGGGGGGGSDGVNFHVSLSIGTFRYMCLIQYKI